MRRVSSSLHPRPGVVRSSTRQSSGLSSILHTFNDQFGNIDWTDADRHERLVIEEIPSKVAEDEAYQDAWKNIDPANARVEHDRALGRVMMVVLKDDTELLEQFSDNEGFRRWLSDAVF